MAGAQVGPTVPGAYRLMHADVPDNVGAGIVLISELRCAACHALPDAVATSIRWNAGELPSLSDQVLVDSTSFLANPAMTNPGTTMPRHDLSPATIVDLNEFLVSLGSTSEQPGMPVGSVERGADLYHTVGCVACHAPRRDPGPPTAEDDPFSPTTDIEYPAPTIPSIPIRNNAQTFMRLFAPTPALLTQHMELTAPETTAIATYLSADAHDMKRNVDPLSLKMERVARGKDAFVQIRCAQCHVGATPADEYDRIAIERPTTGCLAESVQAPAVDYGLTGAQRSAIRDALALESPRTDASWQVLGMAAANNCLACHQRDGFGGVEPGREPYFTTTVEADLGDEGRIPPTLTGVGAKLTPSALKLVLTGHGVARPYMATRMPVFDLGDIDGLVAAFAEADRGTVTAEANVTGLEHHHRNHYGRELVGTDALGCVSCHELNGHQSLGIPAIDLARAPTRLRPEWFMAYMLDPASLRSGTRMPAYFPEGKSTYPKLFKGGARQQIEAIWIYLREIDQTRLPVGMEESKQYVVVPTDAPVVHRTFLKEVGERAIAVGFPEGVHFAFDATQVRASLAWRGSFLDANSTWNDRFSPYVKPLSDDRWAFPDAMPFAVAATDEWPSETGADAGYRFKGFGLDGSGTPTFRYTFEGMTIAERITPMPDGKGLRRQFAIEHVLNSVAFLVARGETVKASDSEYRIDDQWTARISVSEGEMKVERRTGATPALVAILQPDDSRIMFTEEVEW